MADPQQQQQQQQEHDEGGSAAEPYQTLQEFCVARECRSGVSSRINMWKNREDTDNTKSRVNPFSQRWSSSTATDRVRNLADDQYGTPEAGTLTDQRGRLAGQRISNEVWELCCVIRDLGYPTEQGTWLIDFGSLFEAYTKISNKVVGMLMRARRQHLLEFDGEMLYQGRDNDVIITLLKDPDEIDHVESIRQTLVRRF